jgi:uncharacterized membrane protein YqaE (UPF0057 family)
LPSHQNIQKPLRLLLLFDFFFSSTSSSSSRIPRTPSPVTVNPPFPSPTNRPLDKITRQNHSTRSLDQDIPSNHPIKRLPTPGMGFVVSSRSHYRSSTMNTVHAHGNSKGGSCLAVLAFILPPLAVFARTGCNADFVLNIVFTILGWIPGILHAWYIILRYPNGKGAGLG